MSTCADENYLENEERTSPQRPPPSISPSLRPSAPPCLRPFSAGGTASRRWVSRRKGRKKRQSAGGRSRRRRAGSRDADASPSSGRGPGTPWRSRHGGSGLTRTRSRSVGGVADFGTPLRRRYMAAETSRAPSFSGGLDCGGGGGGAGEGEFAGGGHALCSARSR